MKNHTQNHIRFSILHFILMLCIGLSGSLFAQRLPLPETIENGALYRWENKAILDSKLLDDAETPSKWKHVDLYSGSAVRKWEHGSGQGMSFTTERFKDGAQSVRLIMPTKGDSATNDNRSWGYCTAVLPINNENWANWNRISLWIYPEATGHKNISIYLHVVTTSGATRDNILLKNGQWNHIVHEFEHLKRESVTSVEIRCRLHGNEPGTSTTITYDIDRLMLEKVVPDYYKGWAVAPGKISFSHIGYSLGAPKTAMAGDGLSGNFKLVNASTQQAIVSKPLKDTTSYRGNFKVMDFSDVNIPGTYYLEVGGTKSKTFNIGEQVWLDPLLKGMNYYYCQRVGEAIPGVHDASNKDWRMTRSGQSYSIWGGWYDAGDLSQGLYNTAEATLAFLKLIQHNQKNNTNVALTAQLLEETNVGLDWLQVAIAGGSRPKWSIQGWWTDNIIGNNDDCVSNAATGAGPFFTAAAAQAVAYMVLKNTDAIRANKALTLAETDYQTGQKSIWKYIARTKKGDAPACLDIAPYIIAGVELYNATQKQAYKDTALKMASYLIDTQERNYIPGSNNLCGFLYEKSDKKYINHSIEGSGAHEHDQLIALGALCEAFPDHADWMKWYSAVAMYSEFYKKITANNTAPYNMLPGGIYSKTEPLESWEGFWASQIAAGQKVGTNHVVTGMPVSDGGFGQLHLQLTQAKGVTVGAQLRGDLAASQLAEQQLEWTIGKNPFSASFMYGEGYDYIPLYTPMCGNIVGALPVGMPTVGVDQPDWKPSLNQPSPHEQWIQTSNRFVYLVSDLIDPAMVKGVANTEVNVLNVMTKEVVKVQPVNGQFSTKLPQGNFEITVDGLVHHVVALPNANITLDPTLDFVLSSVRETVATKTKNVTITLEANGSGTHTFAIRTSNLAVTEIEKTITLQSGTKQTIVWTGTITSENSPAFVVIVPDGDIKRRKEVPIKEIVVATVPVEPPVTGLPATILVSQDTYIDNTTPTTAKGTATSTFASYGPSLTTPRIRDSYFKFMLTDFKPENATSINSVKLSLKVGYVFDATTSQKLILRDVNKSGIDLNALTFDGLTAAGLNAVPFYLDNSIITDFTLFPGEKQLGSKIAQFEGALAVNQLIEFDVTDYVKWAITNEKQEVTMNLAKDVATDNGLDNRAWFHTLEASAGKPVLNIVYNPSSVKSVPQTNYQWKLFPTIVKSGEINVTCTENLETPALVKIFSLTGVMLTSISTNSSLAIPIGNFKAGSYFVTIASAKGLESHRFIIAK